MYPINAVRTIGKAIVYVSFNISIGSSSFLLYNSIIIFQNNFLFHFTSHNQSLTQLNEGIFKEPIQINYIYNYTSEVQKVFEYECEETGIYVINMSGSDFYTHCFITDKRYAAQIAAMSNNGVATKIQCTNQYKMYKGHKYNIELWNATFQMYKY